MPPPAAALTVTGAQVIVLSREAHDLLLQHVQSSNPAHRNIMGQYIVLFHLDGVTTLPHGSLCGQEIEFHVAGIVQDADVQVAIVDLGRHVHLFKAGVAPRPHLVVRHSDVEAPTVKARQLVKEQRPFPMRPPMLLRGFLAIRTPDGAAECVALFLFEPLTPCPQVGTWVCLRNTLDSSVCGE
jgi:hypothetical protein